MDTETLNQDIKTQNYSNIIKTLYHANCNDSYEWTLKNCEDGHVPLWYFLVRSYHLTKFDNNRYDTIRCAFKMALKSIIMSMIHISTCIEVNKSFDIVNILTSKYDEKFKDYLTVKIFEDCLIDVYEYFDLKFKKEIQDIDSSDPISVFPEPYWSYNCSKGGWGQSAIQCYYNEEEINYIKKHFIENYSDACQKRFIAFEQSKEKIKLILDNLKSNDILELEKGFSTIDLVKKNILKSENNLYENCFVQ
jgi:hypothetical protein